MAKKTLSVSVELVSNYVNKPVGTVLGLNSILAARLVDKGVAKYSTEPAIKEQVKETIVKQ